MSANIIECSACGQEYDTEEDGYCCDDTTNGSHTMSTTTTTEDREEVQNWIYTSQTSRFALIGDYTIVLDWDVYHVFQQIDGDEVRTHSRKTWVEVLESIA